MATQILSHRLHLQNLVRLRWVLIFADGSRKHGAWDNSGYLDRKLDADMQARGQLSHACIEAKQISTAQLALVAECKASEYLRHRWLAVAGVPFGANAGPLKVMGAVQGMQLVSETLIYDCYKDGKINIRPNHERAISAPRYTRI